MPDTDRSPIANAVASLPAPPDNAPSAFRDEQEALRANGLPDTSSSLGVPLPAAELLSATGTTTTLDEARAGLPAVLVLYRGAWCPFCNIALRAYQDQLLPALLERGVTLIALSPQKPDSSLTMKEKNELDFVVLSDPGNQVAVSLGVLTHPSAEARALQLEHGFDVADKNVDATTGLPMPTTIILDQSGVVRWIDVHPDYTTRTEPAQILRALDEFGL